MGPGEIVPSSLGVTQQYLHYFSIRSISPSPIAFFVNILKITFFEKWILAMRVIQTRGLNAWVVYTLVGLLLALMAHRRESDHQMEKYSPSLQFPFFVKYHQYSISSIPSSKLKDSLSDTLLFTPQGGPASHNEVLLLPPNWRSHLWLAWWFGRYNKVQIKHWYAPTVDQPFFYSNPKTKLYFQRDRYSVRGLHKSWIRNYADQQRPPSSTGASNNIIDNIINRGLHLLQVPQIISLFLARKYCALYPWHKICYCKYLKPYTPGKWNISQIIKRENIWQNKVIQIFQIF